MRVRVREWEPPKPHHNPDGQTTAERREKKMKGFEISYLRAKARISRLSTKKKMASTTGWAWNAGKSSHGGGAWSWRPRLQTTVSTLLIPSEYLRSTSA